MFSTIDNKGRGEDITITRHDLRDAIARAVAVVALTGVALIHVLDAPGTFQSAPYKGWLYVTLIVGSLATAAALIRSSDRRAWAAAAALPAGSAIAFIVSRTIGLPQGADDIGNWTESLGLSSLFVEGALIALAGAVLLNKFGIRPRLPALAPSRIGQPERA